MGLLLAIGGCVVLLDQLSKLLVVYALPLHSGREVIPGLFNLVHVRNPGAAFSLLAGADPSWRQIFFVAMSLLGIGVILYAYKKSHPRDHWSKVALAFLFGGATGNLIDRLRLGEVIDFLDVYIGSYHWPAFNVADSAITIGALLLVLALLKGPSPDRRLGRA